MSPHTPRFGASTALDPHRRDLSPATLAILAPVLLRHGFTAEQWAGVPRGEAAISARVDVTTLLHGLNWTKAAIGRALGVDDRMVNHYLDLAGVDDHRRSYRQAAPPPARRLPGKPEHRLLVGYGERHDCTNNRACVDEVLAAYPKSKGPERLHCPAKCSHLVKPSRDAALRDGMLGGRGQTW